MDKIHKILIDHPRRLRQVPPLLSVGYLPKKKHRIRRTFSHCGYSIILEGKGTYRFGKSQREISAPCLITQWPGATLDYGPNPGTRWRELFLNWNEDAHKTLCDAGFDFADTPVRPLRISPDLQNALDAFLSLARLPEPPSNADRLDLAAQQLLAECFLSSEEKHSTAALAAVRNIREQIDADLLAEPDVASLAAEQGLTPSRFRRQWMRLVGCPPARYIAQQRLRLACQKLEGSEMPIGEIARNCGFADPLYFARRFRKFTGMTATEYRDIHRENSP